MREQSELKPSAVVFVCVSIGGAFWPPPNKVRDTFMFRLATRGVSGGDRVSCQCRNNPAQQSLCLRVKCMCSGEQIEEPASRRQVATNPLGQQRAAGDRVSGAGAPPGYGAPPAAGELITESGACCGSAAGGAESNNDIDVPAARLTSTTAIQGRMSESQRTGPHLITIQVINRDLAFLNEGGEKARAHIRGSLSIDNRRLPDSRGHCWFPSNTLRPIWLATFSGLPLFDSENTRSHHRGRQEPQNRSAGLRAE
jgi:hypothetical protein